MEKFGKNEARLIVDALKESARASLDYNSQNSPELIREYEVDLTVERSEIKGNVLRVNFPFHCAYVTSATDSNVFLKIHPNSNSDGSVGATLRLNDVFEVDNPSFNFGITNPAQQGKIKIQFFLFSRIKQGSTRIEVTSEQRAFSVGGYQVQQNEKNIHLSIPAFNYSLLPNENVRWGLVSCMNNPHLNTYQEAGSHAFVVPAGQEFIVTGLRCRVYTALDASGTFPDQIFCFIGSSMNIANSGYDPSSFYDDTDTDFNLLFPNGRGSYPGRIGTFLTTVNPNGSDFPNAFNVMTNTVFSVPAGEMIALGLLNYTGSSTGAGLTPSNTFSFEVIGYLRDAV